MSDRKRLQANTIILHYRDIVRERRLSETRDTLDAIENLRAYDAAPVLDITIVPDGRRRVLIEILRFFIVNKKAPKVREIMRQLHLAVATVVEHVGKLRADEWLRSDITASGGLAIVPTPEALDVYEALIEQEKKDHPMKTINSI